MGLEYILSPWWIPGINDGDVNDPENRPGKDEINPEIPSSGDEGPLRIYDPRRDDPSKGRLPRIKLPRKQPPPAGALYGRQNTYF